jgi:hypothetical protein
MMGRRSLGVVLVAAAVASCGGRVDDVGDASTTDASATTDSNVDVNETSVRSCRDELDCPGRSFLGGRKPKRPRRIPGVEFT